jgi:acetyl-CoA C-acetyltransferase
MNMKIEDVVIADGVRLPIGRFGGSLLRFQVYELGGLAIAGLLERTGIDPASVDDVIMACNRLDGVGLNPARSAAFLGGIPLDTPAFTVIKVCPAGLKAAAIASQEIRLGEAEIIVVGGFESMSNMPHILKGMRFSGQRMGDMTLTDSFASIVDPTSGMRVGEIAERTAERYDIPREDQDAYALESHLKAKKAWDDGVFAAEVIPVEIPASRKEPARTFDTDECLRPDISLEKMAKLRPAYMEEGTVTAGNASGITDGAAALLLCSRERAEALGLAPKVHVVGYEFMGLKPEDFTDGPALVIPKVLEKTGLTLDDITYLEVNEAFAVQILANEKELKWDRERLNVHGGAIALGHPTGYSGARLLLHLTHILKPGELGLAALCGGQGIAGAMILRGE